MSLFFPDELEHNNPNFAIADAGNIRGGMILADDIAGRDAVPLDKRKIGQFATIGTTSKATYRYDGSDVTDINWQNTSKWTVLATGGNAFDYVDLNVLAQNPAYKQGRLFYDPVKKAVSYYNDVEDITVNLGQEVLFLVENQTGQTISNGKVVYPDPVTIIGLADAHFKEKSRVIAVATHDIADGQTGYVTKLGQVGGLDTSAFSLGQVLYLGADGNCVPDKPDDGSYVVVVGIVDVVDANEGVITVDTSVSELTVEVTDTNGFPPDQRSDTTLSVNEGTRTFTISPNSDEFHFYELGDKYEKTEAENVVWTDQEGEHWFYYQGGVLIHQFNPSLPERQDIILKYCFTAAIYWDITNQKVIGDIQEERHGISMSPQTHLYLHLTRGAQWITGFGLGDFTIDGNGNDENNLQFSVASGVYFDEDINHNGDTLPFPASIPILYNDGSNANIREANNPGYSAIADVGGTGRIYYNEFTGTVWQLTPCPTNDFCLYHIFGFNGININVVSVMGQETYGTIGAARDAASTEIADLKSQLPFAEMIPLGTVIYQTRDTYTNSMKARLRSVDGNDYVDWRTTELAQGSTPSSHSNLTNVQFAGVGVSQGHINDQTQAIAGEKQFINQARSGENIQAWSGAVSFDCANGNFQSAVVSSTAVISLINKRTGSGYTLDLLVDGTGGYTLTFDSTFGLIDDDGEINPLTVSANERYLVSVVHSTNGTLTIIKKIV
jgi:hypothetical protein